MYRRPELRRVRPYKNKFTINEEEEILIDRHEQAVCFI